jgi:hypothetical protein
MNRKNWIVLGALLLALCLTGITYADSLISEGSLFRQAKNLASDAHVQGMESFPVGPAFTPEGAPSIGHIIGQTRPGDNRVQSRTFKGKALGVLNGEAWIQEAGGPIDDFAAGAGYRADFPRIPVSQIQVEVITAYAIEVEVEAFFLNQSLAPPQRFKVDSENGLLRLDTGGVFFDRIEVRAVKSGPGFALDNLGVGGNMVARPVVCRTVQ